MFKLHAPEVSTSDKGISVKVQAAAVDRRSFVFDVDTYSRCMCTTCTISRRLQAQRSMGSQPTPWTPPSAGRTCTGCSPSLVCLLSSRVSWPRRMPSWPWSTAFRVSSCQTMGGGSWMEAQPRYWPRHYLHDIRYHLLFSPANTYGM